MCRLEYSVCDAADNWRCDTHLGHDPRCTTLQDSGVRTPSGSCRGTRGSSRVPWMVWFVAVCDWGYSRRTSRMGARPNDPTGRRRRFAVSRFRRDFRISSHSLYLYMVEHFGLASICGTCTEKTENPNCCGAVYPCWNVSRPVDSDSFLLKLAQNWNKKELAIRDNKVRRQAESKGVSFWTRRRQRNCEYYDVW